MISIALIYSCLLFQQPKETLYNRKTINAVPAWAVAHIESTDPAAAPKGAGAWCLLNEVLLGLNSDGEVISRHRVIYIVLNQSAAESLSVYAQSVSTDVGKVTKIEGFHLPFIGPVQKVTTDDMVTQGQSLFGQINQNAASYTQFDFISKGSVIVMESLKREKHYLGSLGIFPLLTEFPTKEFHLKLVEEDNFENPMSSNIELVAYGLEEWGLTKTAAKNEIFVRNIPGLRESSMRAPHQNFYPYVTCLFLSSPEDQARYGSWDQYARWYWKVFSDIVFDKGVPPLGPVDKPTLIKMMEPLRTRITYQQIYLSNARGFVPAKGTDVLRRAYGDCKDMAACFAYMGEQSKVLVYPVLANIVDGLYLTGSERPHPAFNHLIAAVPLQKSLGLPAEVTVKGKTYLIFDATAGETSFGYLPRGYLGRSVLICTEEGAVWAPIPETALEPGELKFQLDGDLDQNHQIKGTFLLEETGNVAYYQSTLKQYGATQVQSQIQGQFPPLVTLKHLETKITEAGHFQSRWEIVWPEFLHNAGPGYRLPEQILEDLDVSLRVAGQPRIMPIMIEGRPKTTWKLNLNLAKPLTPAKAEAEYHDSIWGYDWRASGGTKLELQYTSEARQTFFRHSQTAAGVTAFAAYQSAYQRFRREMTLLR